MPHEMTSDQRDELDRQMTTPPHDCAEDGHAWRLVGKNSEGDSYYKCRKCGMECEE